MLTPWFHNKFEKDIKRQKKRGKDIEKLKAVITMLIEEESLPARYKNHNLSDDYAQRQECHIEPDWLLIYRIEESKIIFERTGSHSDLF